VADPKTHAALRKHLATAKAAHKQVGDSMDKIEQIMSALKGAQQPQPQPQQPAAPMPGGMSPLGGMAGG
jgi:hypothetical protein